MKSTLLLFFMMLFSMLSEAQHLLKAYIKDVDTKEPLAGATAVLKGTSTGSSADSTGLVEINNV